MLTPSELDGCIELIAELSAFAAERIVAVRPRRDEISTKTSRADWVTETDLAVERHVRAAVLERFPSHRSSARNTARPAGTIRRRGGTSIPSTGRRTSSTRCRGRRSASRWSTTRGRRRARSWIRTEVRCSRPRAVGARPGTASRSAASKPSR